MEKESSVSRTSSPIIIEAEVYLRQRRISLRLRLLFDLPQGGEQVVEPRPEGLPLRPSFRGIYLTERTETERL